MADVKTGLGVGKAPRGLPHMDVEKFREEGYLQEVNRRFFHPLGLALSVVRWDDGTWHLGEILDARDDPKGFCFDWSDEPAANARARAASVQRHEQKARRTRKAALGYVVQPLPTDEEGAS